MPATDAMSALRVPPYRLRLPCVGTLAGAKLTTLRLVTVDPRTLFTP
jgi:hypothetical protein